MATCQAVEGCTRKVGPSGKHRGPHNGPNSQARSRHGGGPVARPDRPKLARAEPPGPKAARRRHPSAASTKGRPRSAASRVVGHGGDLIQVVEGGLYVITAGGYSTPIRIADGHVVALAEAMSDEQEALAWLRGYKAAVEVSG
jgi:hypothetical protein